MTITLAALAACIENNAHNLVPCSLRIDHGSMTVSFEVTELAVHDVTAGLIAGVIVDTADGGDTHYATLDAYAVFLRGEGV